MYSLNFFLTSMVTKLSSVLEESKRFCNGGKKRFAKNAKTRLRYAIKF